jgi:hypothetical protein
LNLFLKIVRILYSFNGYNIEVLFLLDIAAREALTDMPPRNVNELDTITLHNLAIMNMEEDPTGGFEKLTFLISNDIFPREAFVNLCLLYLKYEVNRDFVYR